MGHYPVLSVGKHGPTKCLESRLLPLLHRYRVTATFFGHDHNLQVLDKDDPTYSCLRCEGYHVLTIPMLRLFCPKNKDANKLCHVGIRMKALAEYSQITMHHFVLDRLAISSMRVKM